MLSQQRHFTKPAKVYRASLYLEAEETEINKAFELAEALRELMIAAGCQPVDEEELANIGDDYDNTSTNGK